MRPDDFYLITGMAISAALVLTSHALWLFYEAWR